MHSAQSAEGLGSSVQWLTGSLALADGSEASSTSPEPREGTFLVSSRRFGAGAATLAGQHPLSRCRPLSASRSRLRSQAWRAAACRALPPPQKPAGSGGAERTRVGGGGGRFCGGRVIRGRGAPLAQAAAVICRSLSQAAAIDYGSPPSGVEAATITNVQAATTINRCHLATPPSGGARNHCGCAGITA